MGFSKLEPVPVECVIVTEETDDSNPTEKLAIVTVRRLPPSQSLCYLAFSFEQARSLRNKLTRMLRKRQKRAPE